MKNEFDDHDARLRAALRDGDPAAGESLVPEEVRALRRAMLNAAEDAPRRAWLPAAALTAVAAGIAAAIVLYPAPPRVATRPAAPPAIVAPAPPPRVSAELAVPEPPAADRPARTARGEARVPAPQPEPPLPPAPEPPILPTQPVLADAVPEPRPLQIQFATPGGTRIIWMLAEESES
ncbi:MAG TPA: hypothetical protein VNJ70_12855 [Thermoanaerobaculia bacterium]|nr:hypothetical protein [Thermoanaerobaculia bacterium]